ncbi:MAG: hypothetical protein IKL89_00920 [Clostridia bacterium]|nr:hypothetical protein [Clostridia bacterium]
MWRKPLCALICALMASLCLSACARPSPELSDLAPLFADERAEVLAALSSRSGEISREDIRTPRGSARRTRFPDGSLFWCECSVESFSLTLTASGGWRLTRLNPADNRAPILAESEELLLLLQPPLAREPARLTGSNYRAVDSLNGTVSCSGEALTLRFSGECADWWLYAAPGAKAADWLSWISLCAVDKFGGDNRMTLDGYYYTTPENYKPSGPGLYWRIPAAYIATRLARQTEEHHAHQLSAAMLDLHTAHYNEAGFFPSLPESRWLSGDYAIGTGFHDTRFNTDLAYALLLLGKSEGISAYREKALGYAQFLCTHADSAAERSENGGIFAPDYSHPSGNLPTLTSLNHQLAEILFLLETEKPAYTAVARRLLLAIEDTAALWLRPDGDLHYARYPDGTFGGIDYPYLTYNDLYALNRYLGGNPALQLLMDSKLQWMTERGITGYITD